MRGLGERYEYPVDDVDRGVRGLDIAAYDVGVVDDVPVTAGLCREDDRSLQRGQMLAVGKVRRGVAADGHLILQDLRQVGLAGEQRREAPLAERYEGRIATREYGAGP